MSNIIAFKRPNKSRFKGMDKQELMEEMIKFQEKYQGTHTHFSIAEGIDLFTELWHLAETKEMLLLCNNYIKYLQGQTILLDKS